MLRFGWQRVTPPTGWALKVCTIWRHNATSSEDASAATLAFLGKLVAKSGRLEVGSATRLLPSRMAKSLNERYGGKLTSLVAEGGHAYGLAVGGEGTLIVPAGAVSQPAKSPPVASPESSPAAPVATTPEVQTPAAPSATMPSPSPPAPPLSFETAPPEALPQTVATAVKMTPPMAKPAAVGKGPPAVAPFAATGKPTSPATAVKKPAAPPPPPPPPPKLPNLGGNRVSPTAPMNPHTPDVFNMQLRTWKSPAEVVDSLMEYVPTFWIRARHVHNALPHEMKEMYQERMRVHQFLRKFQFYFDSKVSPEGPYVKVRDSCSHPKKGFADDRYASSLLQESTPGSSGSGSAALGIDANTLEGRVRALLSNAFTSIKTFEASLPPDVVQHKDFDKVTGVSGIFERFPNYFQVVDGNVRLRQFGVAPNALDERTVATSPEPELFRKLYDMIPENPEEAIETAQLFAALNADEKALVKKNFRSFPRFLRQHGRVISLTQDNLTVRRFCEVLPEDLEASATHGGGDDIIGKRLPTETSFDASQVEIAIKELYDVLPLLQACPLHDAIFMIPATFKEALAKIDVVAELREYPSYFSVWQFPDDPKIIIVQRASLETPDVPAEEIVNVVQPLIPQGGIVAERLMRRVPLNLQRYFYRHGLKKSLQPLGKHFMVVGDRVLSLGV